MVLQPPIPPVIIRVDSIHLLVEAFGVIHLLPMAQLMYHDRIEHLGRCQQQKAVEVQIPFGRTTSPSGLLMTYGDLAVGDSNYRCIVLYPLREDVACTQGEFFQLFTGQRRIGQIFRSFALFFQTGDGLLNPSFFFIHKVTDISLGDPSWRPNHHI